ncbi:MAG TPA: HAMP domain-containing sensor histidine kinase [Acidimicrobiales bacterium]|nr:HAMP domain-containing sensor histidine kinase [Acidimicrobiales bacterium]
MTPGRRVSLRTRVTLAFAIGALVLSAGLATLTYELARSYLVRQRETSGLRQAYANARLVRTALASEDAVIEELLASVQSPARSSPVLRHKGGWYKASEGLGLDAIPRVMLTTVGAGTPARQRIALGGMPHLVVGIPLPAVDGAYFEVFQLVELDRTLRILLNSSIAAALVTTVAGATIGWWASRRVLSPVAAVSAAAAAVASGRFDVRLEESGDPELSRMAGSFNQMTEALLARIRRDTRFASDVSHELRSPLTTLAAALEVVSSRRHEMPERARLGLDLLAAEIARFERLVENLLEISRIDAGVEELVVEDVVLGQFVREALRTRREPTPEVHLDPGAAETVVRADKRRLERVLANLADNAERHGGGVTRVVVERDDGWAGFAVEDAGAGVPPEEREPVFERFFRGRAAGMRGAGEGSGLGLALVREHVGLHGGRVWVEERAGGGARFVVRLPVVP